MSSFAKCSTGVEALDKVLDSLRLGDNVVWQVDAVEDYACFVRSFSENALRENRRLVYVRFGEHPPLVPEDPRIKIYQLDPSAGFESFSAQVHHIATEEGRGVYYVFDCLSDLLSTWATDLMIGNFFRVTCPYLFELDTIAYFSLLRGRNSYDTIARIRETTQLLLDVYRREEQVLMHPLKVWNRYSPTMFLPHVRVGDDFLPITSSMEASRLFSDFHLQGPGSVERKLDYWDRVFMKAQEIVLRAGSGDLISLREEREMLEQLCRMIIGREERMLNLALRYLCLQDLLDIRNRLLGTGYIGGKSAGMLIARKILQADRERNWEALMEQHDSFYIGSDVYYTYLVENGCWNLRLEQKTEGSYFSVAPRLREKILTGEFPAAIREQISQILQYYGQSPIIVRSSSLLEDGFGNAFAGKYESVFCVNQGDLTERYQILENAIKTVYASTMSDDALAYRWQRGMANRDEQMALLVQRVSGSHHSKYFFPDLAGVAMSNNPFVWRDDMDSHSGMMRLVLGLGTRAVNRVEEDYPRVVALDRPLLRPESSVEERVRYSQHKVDLLDTSVNDLVSMDLRGLAGLADEIKPWDLVAERDHETSRRMKEMGLGQDQAWILTFDQLLSSTPIPSLMNELLQVLEKAYVYPVDTEFTINMMPDRSMRINLLQCRPLQTWKRSRKDGAQTDEHEGATLFSTRGHFMGGDDLPVMDKILYVEPQAYIALPLNEKYQVARLVGKINRIYSSSPRCLAFIGPGRWGTSTPSLGVPVSFAEICQAGVLVEVAVKQQGLMPELSFGTHFFQDLVETQIFYAALFPGEEGVEFDPQVLGGYPNQLAALWPQQSRWQEVIRLVDLQAAGQALFLEMDWQSQVFRAYIDVHME
ncbi:MAG TPA: PEP/pyruvate-binding domain-containing protein [Syntrophomonadaceae bacterium]|nr:PEP/pyruvate-binding domain-containing protein [Syntrophomonadaceae bacterium]